MINFDKLFFLYTIFLNIYIIEIILTFSSKIHNSNTDI